MKHFVKCSPGQVSGIVSDNEKRSSAAKAEPHMRESEF